MAQPKVVAIKMLRLLALTSGVVYGLHRYNYLEEFFEMKRTYGSFLRHYIMLDNNNFKLAQNVKENSELFEFDTMSKISATKQT